MIWPWEENTMSFDLFAAVTDRIIAALASKIYIMQSADRSGTMTTVNEGLELGRNIKVLPYDLFDPNGIHNNRLIYEGAEPILLEEIAI